MFTESEIMHLIAQTPQLNTAAVNSALDLAKKAHYAQIRDDGSLYLDAHIYPVARNIHFRYKLSPYLVTLFCSALLHDTLEDSDISEEELSEGCGQEVMQIVKALTKTRQENMHGRSPEEKIEGNRNYLKRVLAGGEKAVICKLEDRLQNLSSITKETIALRPEKYKRYIFEVELLFLPLAKKAKTKINYVPLLIEEVRRLKVVLLDYTVGT